MSEMTPRSPHQAVLPIPRRPQVSSHRVMQSVSDPEIFFSLPSRFPYIVQVSRTLLWPGLLQVLISKGGLWDMNIVHKPLLLQHGSLWLCTEHTGGGTRAASELSCTDISLNPSFPFRLCLPYSFSQPHHRQGLTSKAHQSCTIEITCVSFICSVKAASHSGSISMCCPTWRVIGSIPLESGKSLLAYIRNKNWLQRLFK